MLTTPRSDNNDGRVEEKNEDCTVHDDVMRIMTSVVDKVTVIEERGIIRRRSILIAGNVECERQNATLALPGSDAAKR